MYSDMDLEKYADVIYWSLTRARGKVLMKSDLVEVRYDTEALPLAEAVAIKLYEEGNVPVLRPRLTAKMEHDFFAQENVKRLIMEIPGDRELAGQLSGSIFLLAPEAMDYMVDIDPDLISKVERSRKSLRNVLESREAAGDFGRTVAVYPSSGQARAAGLDLEEYGRLVRQSCKLGCAMPVKDWKLLVRRMDGLLDWLNSLPIKSLRVQSDSVDLLFQPGLHRRWLGFTGRNMPSFEFFIAPDWRTVEGIFTADLTSYRRGNVISGVTLELIRGEAVKLSAGRGLNFALEQLRMDNGACRLGEFSLVDKRFSTIDRFMANPIFDENFGGEYGSCHIGLGQSPLSSYNGPLAELDMESAARLGFNRSALHWDLVNTGSKRVTARLADGSKMILYEDGEFSFDV